MTDLRGPVALGLLVAAAGLAVGVWVVRRLAGPVFAYELTVLARRGYQPRLRAGLVIVLLAVLLLTYAAEFGWDALGGQTPTVDPRSGRFAERFALTTLAVQLLAVMVLTPAVVGSAVTEERDRGTLDLLRTTDLTDREIVVGKLLARLAVVGGVVAAGLPVLGLTLLFGGIDPRLVLELYAVTAVTAFGLGALSLYLGTVLNGLRGVLAATYGAVGLATLLGGCLWTLPGAGGVSPPALAFVLFARNQPMIGWLLLGRYWWVSVAVFGLLYGVGGLVLARLAVGEVRTTGVRRPDEAAVERRGRRRFFARPLGDDENPLLWQEREFGGRRFGGGELRLACGTAALFLFGAALFVGLATSIERGVWIAGAVARAVRPLVAAAAVLLPLAVGLRLAGAVAGERERQTLDALLMLPGDRRHLLRAKAMAALGWVGWAVWLVAGSLAAAVLVGGIRVFAGLLAACHLAAVVAAAGGLAGWLTVRERTAARATVWFLVVLLAVNVVPPLLAPLADWLGGDLGDMLRAFSPAFGMWAALGGAGRLVLGPVIVFVFAGWLLWSAAEWYLEAGVRRG